MGYRTHVYSPDSDSPAGQICHAETVAEYDDIDALTAFAQATDVITLEFENIPSTALELLSTFTPVFPQPDVLSTTQHRLREKTFLFENGFPVTPFMAIRSLDSLLEAVKTIGTPAVLKTAGFGYDGKGQCVIRHRDDAPSAYQAIGQAEAVLEQFVAFEKEISVIGARTPQGQFAAYTPIENQHVNHILDVSMAPAQISPAVEQQALHLTQSIMEAFQMVGVLCVEFFLTEDHRLLINELAPRPHNSGHLTIEGALTSQFEQQLRAICGLPLGRCDWVRPSAMANLLGDLWPTEGEPDWEALCRFPEIKLHLYGKKTPKPGRKMGHITALNESPLMAAQRLREARNTLTQFANVQN
jgi:5-(carboxyamino)imidazole ribonucleotide synthase